MATREATMQFLADQAKLGARLSYRKMFGEYALYVDGIVVALVCDDTLFVKETAAGAALLAPVTHGAPYPGAKPHLVVRDEVDDPEQLRRVLLATAAALPPPAPKKTHAKAKKAPVKTAAKKPSTKTSAARKPASKKTTPAKPRRAK